MLTQPTAASGGGRTIVVIGGGIAGLLAAAACAPHVHRVVVVERDALPDGPGARPGTPQALHAHGVLASGRMAMESLLPGLTAELVAAGAISRGDMGSVGRWWIGGGLIADCELGVTGIAVSRPLLEATLRQRVRRLSNVELCDGTEVTGLASLTRRHRVTGVWVNRHRVAESGGEGSLLDADLVVDASGRAARAAGWFEQQGWRVPHEDRITVGVRYATTHIVAEPDDLDGRVVCISAAIPTTARAAAAIRQEDGTWVVTLCGYANDRPPVDEDGYKAFARTLVSPDIAKLIDGRDLIHAPRPFGFPDMRRRRFETLRRMPAGYVPIGDAICSLDPTFGQGMSVAALQAVALRDALSAAAKSVDVARGYLSHATRIVDAAWAITTGADLQLPGIHGTTKPAPRIIARYLQQVQAVAQRDRAIAEKFLRVTNLLAPPSTLLSPRTVAAVLRPRDGSR